MEINEKEASALRKLFENLTGENIVLYYHCFDPRLTYNGGIPFFEKKTGLSKIEFHRDSRAGGIRGLVDGKPEVKKDFMRSVDIPINNHGIKKEIKITILMQPHNDCGDYMKAYSLVSPFAEPTTTWSAHREKMFQINHMEQAEEFIRKYYKYLSNISFTFIHSRAVLLDKKGENIRFDILKIT